MKKIIFVETDNIEKNPPAISIINALAEISNVELHICSLVPSNYLVHFCNKNRVALHDANGQLLSSENFNGIKIIKKIAMRNKYYNNLWRIIDEIYNPGDFIWINKFDTLKLLGKKILKYRYVIHLYELLHEVRIYHKFPCFRFNLRKYLRCAYRVVECEYNRACITQAWFDLDNRPAVIPNKLYLKDDVEINVSINDNINNQLDKLSGKKIILYQGILGPERPINVFADAVSEMGDEYAMVVMSSDKIEDKKIAEKVVQLGFVSPPGHLYVTKRAYIGLLVYKADRDGYSINDCLNSIYCAPNKLYEYSKYGLPMIGNDIPGLKYTIENFGAGICIENMTKEKIKDAINKISQNYEKYKQHSLDFYNSVDVKKIIEEEILDED